MSAGVFAQQPNSHGSTVPGPTAVRLIVVPHGNNANVDYNDGVFPDVPEFISIEVGDGVERQFRYGSRRTNPSYEAPDARGRHPPSPYRSGAGFFFWDRIPIALKSSPACNFFVTPV